MSVTVYGGKTLTRLQSNLGAAGSNQYYFRYDWIQEVIIDASDHHPHWQVTTAAGSAPGLFHSDPSNPRRLRLIRPSTPGWVEIAVGGERVRIWFVRASIQVRNAGNVSAGDNSDWNRVLGLLRDKFGNSGYPFTQLGPVQFSTSSHNIHNTFWGQRYGGMVEMVGQVEPADIQTHIRIPFYLARRITGGNLSTVDAQGHQLPANRGLHTSVPVPGQNDSTGWQLGRLSSTGRLYDYDLPGSYMTAANQRGDVHNYNVDFEQVVVITDAGGGDPWPRITSEGLAVSPPVQWRCRLRAEFVSTSGATVQIHLTGSVG